MNAVYKLIWNVSTGTWAVAHERVAARGRKRACRVMRGASAVLFLAGGVAGSAFADVNNGGLQLCNPGKDYGTSIGVTWGQTSAVACRGAYYSFWLGNGVNNTGAGTNDTTAAVWGNAAGELHVVGNKGIFLDGNSTFGGTANLNNHKITNLTAGTADNDAVNVKQMKDAVAAAGGDNPLIKVNGTTAASASGGNSIAIGNNASVTYTHGAAGGIAIGSNAKAYTGADLAFGADASANASGAPGVSAPDYAAALGMGAQVVGGRSLAVGNGASVTGMQSSTDMRGTAVGNASQVTGVGSTAIGYGANASGANSIALGRDTMVARDNAVSFGNDRQQRQLINVGVGTEDTDAVNLQQLKGSAASTAAALGGGAAAAADGTVTLPSYALEDGTYNNVGDALDNLDGRVSRNRQSIIDLGKVVDDLSQGDLGLVSFDAARGSVDVAAGKGGSQVDVSGTDGTRRLAGVANGTRDDDAVTVAQLRAAGALDPTSGTFLSVLTYDDASLGKATLGGSGGTTIDNLRNGQVAAGSMQAVNGGQLFQALTDAASVLGGGATMGVQGVFSLPEYVIQGTTYNNVGSALAALDDKVSDISTHLAGQGAPVTNVRDVGMHAAAGQVPPVAAVGAAEPAVAAAGAAVGTGAIASGVGSAAIGEGAVASADNAVALGSGSVADRANSVSVGSAGSERQITNVAEGTEATDAVNKAQLDGGVASANTYTDTKFQGLSDSFDVFKGEVDQRLKNMDRRIDRQGAMSSAMLNMATSAAGVRTDNRVGVGVGFQGGQSALSVGYQRAISERATVTLGGAFSGDDASVGFGAGFGW